MPTHSWNRWRCVGDFLGLLGQMVPAFYLRDLSLPLSSSAGAMWIKGAQDDINTIETIDYTPP